MTFIANTTVKQGGEVKTATSNVLMGDILLQMLQELKLINKHLEVITDEEILIDEMEDTE
jgi:hypothetical protein